MSKIVLSPAYLFIAKPRVLGRYKDGGAVFGITLPKWVVDELGDGVLENCYVAITPVSRGKVQEIVGDDDDDDGAGH